MSNRDASRHARASPADDGVRRSRQGLPARGRGGLKKVVQERIRLASLIIGTLTGRARELAEALETRCIDIACVQETKWTGSKAKDIDEGYKIYYHGRRSNQNGIAVAVSERLRDSVVEISRITDRLLSTEIDSNSTSLRVISCYAPQAGCPDDEKEEFRESIDTHPRSIAPDEHVLVGGDFNDHVGSTRDGYPQCHGGQDFGTQQR